MGCLLDDLEEAYSLYRLCQRSLTETLRPLRRRVSAGRRPLRFPGKPAKGMGPDGRHGGNPLGGNCGVPLTDVSAKNSGAFPPKRLYSARGWGYRLGGMENACPSKGS